MQDFISKSNSVLEKHPYGKDHTDAFEFSLQFYNIIEKKSKAAQAALLSLHYFSSALRHRNVATCARVH